MFGSQGGWSLGAPPAAAAPASTLPPPPHRPTRRLSHSVPASSTRAQFVANEAVQGGRGTAHDTAALNEKLHNLLLDRNQPTFAATTAGAPGGMAFSPSSSRPSTRPPSPSFGARLPSRPSSPAYSHSSSRTRFTGTLELPLLTAPGSTAHTPAVDQQHKLLLARIVELERAYQELARAYERAEREKEYWQGMATGGGGIARTASPMPHTYSPAASLPSSHAPSRPASPARAAYLVSHLPPNPHPSSLLPPQQQQLPSSLRRGHAHSQSWTGLTSLR